MQLKPNSLLQGGKYRIERVLGQGGFGITYLGTQVGLNRKVAIKEFFMKEYCNRDSEMSQVSVGSEGSKEQVGKFRQKFIKEAQNIAALSHPHIIRIHDVFEENGTAYYVMEYWDNGSLADLVKKRGMLSEAESLHYIRQVASALGYIHDRNMNHLDVKPGNILLDEEGNAVLIDFGLSKRYDEEGNQTSTTPVGISHGYAPLEQYKKGGVGTFSPATDIYSLGATLYKLLTGQIPPEANEVNEEGLPPFPAGISHTTVTAIEAAMQPVRKKRLQSVSAFMSLLSGEEEATVIVDPDPKPNPSPQPPPQPAPSPTPAPKPSSLKKWAVPLVVGAVAALAVILWPKGGGDSPEKVETVVAVSDTVAVSDSVAVASAPVSKQEKVEPAQQEVEQEVKQDEAPAPSLLYVTTSPTGATVYVDGKKVGTTPIEGKEVTQGRHTVKITKSGCESISEKKQFGDKPVVLNETLVAEIKEEVKETKPVQTVSQQPVKSSTASSGSINGHKYVDLGLSVKWADRNVGASSPSDYGSYFAWGETSTKSDYSSSTSVTYEKSFSDISGNSQYDAARSNWGGSWRLPTKAECQELVDNCQWVWTTQGVHNGYKVTGPNGNSAFFPAAGGRIESSYSAGKFGCYWSSTPNESNMRDAYGLSFDDGGLYVGWNYRNNGCSVRPVSE